MTEFLWFVGGIVVGVIATFFIVKNNRKRAEAAWNEAELFKAEATALKIKALELFASLKGKV
jgi:hypothetical protein